MPEKKKPRRWGPGESVYLMDNAYKIPWSEIATHLDRSEAACKKKYEEVMNLRKHNGTWKGI